MPITRYTISEKQAALDCLRKNSGHVATTSAETGIPERTLYNWRRKELQCATANPPALPKLPADLDLDDVVALKQLRRQLMSDIALAGPSLLTGLDLLTPYQRALTIRQMLEQLSLIDALIPAETKEKVTRVEFVDPYDGSVSDVPYWARDRNRDETE